MSRGPMSFEPGADLLFTKILAVLGPATESTGAIRQPIEGGSRAFRIDFSHGTFDDYRRQPGTIRTDAEETLVRATDHSRLAVLGNGNAYG